MLSRKRFQLTDPTLGFVLDDRGRRWLSVPAGAVIHVISGPTIGEEDQTVQVCWRGHRLMMFAIDLMADGVELHEELSRVAHAGA